MSAEDVQKGIARACKDAGRNAADVNLIAVSKMQPLEKVTAAIEQGQRLFGENRVQDSAEKWPDLRAQHPDICVHLIGQLQTNKVKDAVSLFDAIHTVDREKLASALGDEMQKQNRILPCFIQVNTGDEEQKGGVSPKETESLYRFATEKAGLQVKGLMCIPPAEDIPDMHFALLHKLSRQLGLQDLSMGMSDDFETAIRYGATYIRVGSAFFGIRENV